MTSSSGSGTSCGRPFCNRSSIDSSSGLVTSSTSTYSSSSCDSCSSVFRVDVEQFRIRRLTPHLFLEEFSIICYWVNLRFIILFVWWRWSKMARHIVHDIPTFQVLNTSTTIWQIENLGGLLSHNKDIITA